MRRFFIQRCLLTITLAVLLIGGILVIGCTNARTEGGDYNANVLHGSDSYAAKETPDPNLHPYIEPTPAAMYTVYEGQFSKADIKLVAALIHCEGPGSSKVGYRAIASIILNRVMNNSGKFPNDIQGVLFQPGQFGYSKSYLESITPNSKALDAANYVFSSHGSTLPKKVLFYRASYLGKPWTEYTSYYATIEGNNYYYGLYYF